MIKLPIFISILEFISRGRRVFERGWEGDKSKQCKYNAKILFKCFGGDWYINKYNKNKSVWQWNPPHHPSKRKSGEGCKRALSIQFISESLSINLWIVNFIRILFSRQIWMCGWTTWSSSIKDGNSLLWFETTANNNRHYAILIRER